MSAEPSPAPGVVVAWRQAAGHTQAHAAALVYVAPRTWQAWEHGSRNMPMGLFELYCLKVEQERAK